MNEKNPLAGKENVCKKAIYMRCNGVKIRHEEIEKKPQQQSRTNQQKKGK